MDRLTKEQRDDILSAFKAKYETDDNPNVHLVCMRYATYDGDYVEVKVKDIFAATEFPHIFNNCNVFVEEIPHHFR